MYCLLYSKQSLSNNGSENSNKMQNGMPLGTRRSIHDNSFPNIFENPPGKLLKFGRNSPGTTLANNFI